jgi:3-hydroxybutyryl-CoA dehydrogenase
MELKKIGVAGAGTMGNGISQACAVAGFEVILTDVAQAQLERAAGMVEAGYLARKTGRGFLP